MLWEGKNGAFVGLPVWSSSVGVRGLPVAGEVPAVEREQYGRGTEGRFVEPAPSHSGITKNTGCPIMCLIYRIYDRAAPAPPGRDDDA